MKTSPQQEEILSVPLTQGKFALVDTDDFESLSQYKWHCHKKDTRGKKYWRACRMAKVNGKRVVIPMHRQIMNAPSGMVVDHINGDELDNRKANLRLVSPNQNNHHRIGTQRNNTSGFRGIYYFAPGIRTKRWTGSINFKGKTYTIPYFFTKEEAHKAWLEKVKNLAVPI